MKTTTRVSLDADKSMGYGHLLMCCKKRQQVHINSLEIGDWWGCVDCGKPLMLRTENGHYLIGESISV